MQVAVLNHTRIRIRMPKQRFATTDMLETNDIALIKSWTEMRQFYIGENGVESVVDEKRSKNSSTVLSGGSIFRENRQLHTSRTSFEACKNGM